MSYGFSAELWNRTRQRFLLTRFMSAPKRSFRITTPPMSRDWRPHCTPRATLPFDSYHGGRKTMSRILWAFVAACVVTISLNAQEPYPQGQGGAAPTTQAPPQAPRTPPAAPAPSASASAADKKVTYSGCIERQPASAAAVTGAANMPFSLTNASAAGAANAPVATSGTGAAASKTYRLDGTESTLSPHVGHKVEITGTIEEQPASPSAGAGAAGATPPAPRLKVDSVKMVSTSCP